jgi:hypothetical protein
MISQGVIVVCILRTKQTRKEVNVRTKVLAKIFGGNFDVLFIKSLLTQSTFKDFQ